MVGRELYLDCAASTPVFPEVAESVKKAMLSVYGNASSPHRKGEEAFGEIKRAREVFARELGCKPWEIVFTSGATESNNLAIWGGVLGGIRSTGRKKILISAIEHSSVFGSAKALGRGGYTVIEIPVDSHGAIDIAVFERMLDSSVALVSIIHGSNELGVVQDLREIGVLCRRRGALFHTDASQSFGKKRITVRELGVDLLSASAHKLGGPKGVGLLYVREGIGLKPLVYGGGQEKGIRSGTENVPGIVGFVKALELGKQQPWKKVKASRDFFALTLGKLGGTVFEGRRMLPGIVRITLPGLDAPRVVLALSEKGIYCSTGSACDSKRDDSRALRAVGFSAEAIKGSLRFSISQPLSLKEIKRVIAALKELL
ncbi:MAG TPA: cysteine desulfurase family protein [Candidatus Nanoarchaeia archaeon]|nr:cysteine desulfurase family protein [Candidatus Nanoarchaeia archaeon]